MTVMKVFGLCCLCWLTVGCGLRPHADSSNQFLLDPACVTQPILMQHCDFAAEPPKCKSIHVAYRQGCGQIEVGEDANFYRSAQRVSPVAAKSKFKKPGKNFTPLAGQQLDLFSTINGCVDGAEPETVPDATVHVCVKKNPEEPLADVFPEAYQK